MELQHLQPFTAKIITSKINFLLKEYNNQKIKIIICGGGRKNKSLLKQIKDNSNKNLFFLILMTLT